jgi:hypothetical protein
MSDKLRDLLAIYRDRYFYEVDIEKEYDFDNITVNKKGIKLKKENNLLVPWRNVYRIKDGRIRIFHNEFWDEIEKDHREGFAPMVTGPDITKAFHDRILLEKFKKDGSLEGTAFWPESIFDNVRVLELFGPIIALIISVIAFYFLMRNQSFDAILFVSFLPATVIAIFIIKAYYNNRGRKFWKWRIEGNELRLFESDEVKGVKYDVFNRKPVVNQLFFPDTTVIDEIMLAVSGNDDNYKKLHNYSSSIFRSLLLWPAVFSLEVWLLDHFFHVGSCKILMMYYYISLLICVSMGVFFLWKALIAKLKEPIVMEKVQWIREYLAEK